jgi:hypothetical protein
MEKNSRKKSIRDPKSFSNGQTEQHSAEYAQRSEPFRSDRGLGERRDVIGVELSKCSTSSLWVIQQ